MEGHRTRTFYQSLNTLIRALHSGAMLRRDALFSAVCHHRLRFSPKSIAWVQAIDISPNDSSTHRSDDIKR